MPEIAERRGSLLPHYLIAAVAARTADEGARLSLVLLAVERTGSVAIGGILVAALLVPHVVAAPLVGLLADRSRQPRLILAASIAVFAGSLFAVGALLGSAPWWLCAVVLLLGGSCGPAITGGLTSQLPGLLGVERVPRAFGLDSTFYNVASMAGPALVGLIDAGLGATDAQFTLAGFAMVGAIGVATLPIARRHLDESSRSSLLGGVAEILRRRPLRIVTLVSTIGQLGVGALSVVGVLLAAKFNQPATAGMLLSAIAAGSLLGSLAWTWRPAAPRRAPLVATLSMIGVGAPLVITAYAPSLAATAVLFCLSGVFVGPFAAALFTTRAHYAAENVRTQVFTIGAGLKVTASAFGAALIGSATNLPLPIQLILVGATPVIAGTLGAILLARRPAPKRHQGD
jgi:MFS family permease